MLDVLLREKYHPNNVLSNELNVHSSHDPTRLRQTNLRFEISCDVSTFRTQTWVRKKDFDSWVEHGSKGAGSTSDFKIFQKN